MNFDRLAAAIPSVAKTLGERFANDALPLLRDLDIADVNAAVSMTCTTADGDRLKFTFAVGEPDEQSDDD